MLSLVDETKTRSSQLNNNHLKPILETSSSQMIILRNKKSSIGSINSVLESSFNDELDSFLKNFVFFSLNKLNDLADLNISINSVQSLISFLELDKKYPGVEQSSTLEDFFNTISGLTNKTKTYLDLFIILTLSNLGYFIIEIN